MKNLVVYFPLENGQVDWGAYIGDKCIEWGRDPLCRVQKWYDPREWEYHDRSAASQCSH